MMKFSPAGFYGHQPTLLKSILNRRFGIPTAWDLAIDDDIVAHAQKHHGPIGSSYKVTRLNAGLNKVCGWIIGLHNAEKRQNRNLAVMKSGN